MTPSPASSPDNDLGRALRGAAIALLVSYPIAILVALFPVELLQPEWQLRASEALINSAYLALMGVVLLALAPRFSTGKADPKWMRRIQSLTVLVVLGFLLLVPIQISANILSTRRAITATSASIRQASKQLDQLQAATTEEAFKGAVAKLPDNVQRAVATLKADSVESRRDQLVDLLKPQLDAARSTNNNLIRQRWVFSIFSTLRTSLLSLMMALGFSAFAFRKPAGPSLLTELLTVRKTLADRRQRAATAAAARPKRQQTSEQLERWKQAQRQQAERAAAERRAKAARKPKRPPAPDRPGSKQKQAGGMFGLGAKKGRAADRRVGPEWFTGDAEPDNNKE